MIFYLFYYIFEGMSIVNLRWNNRLVSEVPRYSRDARRFARSTPLSVGVGAFDDPFWFQ